MKTFQSLMVSTVTLLVVFSSFAQCAVFMQNGKVYDDKFYKIFMDKAPVEEIVKLAVNWNAEKQLDHFDQLYQHINRNDEWATYARDIINAARAVLQKSLKEVGYKKEMSLEEYLVGTFQIQNSMKNEVPQDVLEGIELLDKVDNDSLEKLLNRGSEEELEWELNNLHPYKVVPIPGKLVNIVKGPIKSKPEESQDEQLQESQKSEETPVSESNKSKNEVVPERQKFEDNLVPEPQKFEDNPVPESENSKDKPIPDSPKFEHESISESQESEESLPEPSELGDYVADEQESNVQESESEDQIPKPQESEEVPQKVEETSKELIKESEERAIAQPEESAEAVQPPQES